MGSRVRRQSARIFCLSFNRLNRIGRWTKPSFGVLHFVVRLLRVQGMDGVHARETKMVFGDVVPRDPGVHLRGRSTTRRRFWHLMRAIWHGMSEGDTNRA